MENARPEWVQKLFDEESIFWKNEYSIKPEEEKVRFWSASLHKSMRTQEESGLDPYVFYTDDWLKSTLAREPRFIEMLPKIYDMWGGMFDDKKVNGIIHKLLENMHH